MIVLSGNQSEPVRSRDDGNRETRLQAEIVAWLREALPNSLVLAVWNGCDLIAKSEAAKGRWMGVLAGVADVVVIAAGSPVSLEQREFGLRVTALGHHWLVDGSIDDVRKAITAVGLEVWNAGELRDQDAG